MGIKTFFEVNRCRESSKWWVFVTYFWNSIYLLALSCHYYVNTFGFYFSVKLIVYVMEYSRIVMERSRIFREMFEKILKNLNLYLFNKIFPSFIKFYKWIATKQKNKAVTDKFFWKNSSMLLLITNLLSLNTLFLTPLSFLFTFSF